MENLYKKLEFLLEELKKAKEEAAKSEDWNKAPADPKIKKEVKGMEKGETCHLAKNGQWYLD